MDRPADPTSPPSTDPNSPAARPSDGGQPAATPELGVFRQRIDSLDARIVELLNERAKVVVEVGEFKRSRGIPIYVPHREAQVLGKVLGMNAGPLPNRAIEGVYRELMSGSFALERGLTIGYLGPAGSFSHQAAVRHFGSSVELRDLHDIAGVFSEVQRGHVDYGLVPIENSIHGGVTETLDSLAKMARDGEGAREDGSGVNIYAEVQLEVHHAFLANCPPTAVRRIYSKPEVFSQCRLWLSTQYPGVEQVPVASSSRAVQMVREESERDPKAGVAAIASALAAKLYDVNVVVDRIEDNPNNITRFFVLSRQAAMPSGDDKTSVLFTTLNKPGALVSVLREFDKAGVNLTHIDKRPSGRTNWTYSFFVDAEGHRSEAKMQTAIAGARTHCEHLSVLGSYPRSTRIL